MACGGLGKDARIPAFRFGQWTDQATENPANYEITPERIVTPESRPKPVQMA